MNEINSKIKTVIYEVKNERQFLQKLPATTEMMKDLKSDDKTVLKSFISEYLIEKENELTIDDYSFNRIWQQLSYEEREKTVKVLRGHNQKELAEQLEKKTILFEDLVQESDSVIKMLIENTDRKNLVTALKFTGEGSDYETEKILQRILSVLSVKDAVLIKEDIEYSDLVPKNKILDARKEICRRISEYYRI